MTAGDCGTQGLHFSNCILMRLCNYSDSGNRQCVFDGAHATKGRTFTTSMTSLAVYESSPEVGSSRNSTRGLLTSAMPTFVRFACIRHEKR